MNIPRYWARCRGEGVLPGGERVPLVAYGASDHSHDSAVRAGETKLRAIADRLLQGWGALHHYAYADAPLREEHRADARVILSVHDARTGVGSERPLA